MSSIEVFGADQADISPAQNGNRMALGIGLATGHDLSFYGQLGMEDED